MQQGQVFELKKRAVDGRPVWAYRYRTDGPSSKRLPGGSRARRPRGASARCRCRPSRSLRSLSSAPTVRVSFSSRRPAAVTSISTTPQPLLETRPDRGRRRAASSRLRSLPYVRNLRAPCRYLNLRPLALHGSQPDHARPPLRPSRARRTRARNPAPRRLRGHQSPRRPSLGRPMDAAAAHRRQSRQPKQRLSRRKLKAL